jgi:sec-independent protein translocase protein TatB
MFDFAWSEFGLIALLAVLILGPKELPQAMRTMAKVVRKVRGLASEFQGHINDMVREAELEDVRKSVQKLSSTNVSQQVNKMIDPEGEIDSALKDNPLKDDSQKSAPAEDTSAAPKSTEAPKAVDPPSADTSSVSETAPETPRGQTT